MILLTVLSYNGDRASASAGLSARFDELGGTIGRADNNHLVLPDPERTISRVHARIVFRAGGYAIVDNGSNPISVNELPVGSGREQLLRPGDQVQIGGYVLTVTDAAQPARSDDPFADLFGSVSVGLAAPKAGGAAMGVGPGYREPPTSQTVPGWRSAPPPPEPQPSPAALAPGHIPLDWDPFAPDPVTPLPAAAAPAGVGGAGVSGLGLSLGSGSGESLDELFGLASAPPVQDPLGAAARQALLSQPNTAVSLDPLQSLGRPAAVPPSSQSDHAPELHTPMPLPKVEAARPAAASPSAAPAAPGRDWLKPDPAADEAYHVPATISAVFSWDRPPGDELLAAPSGVTRIQPRAAAKPGAAQAPAAQPAAPAPVELDFALPDAPPVTAPVPVPAPAPSVSAAPVGSSGSTSNGQLLSALLDGLGVPGLRIESLTPELMRLIGVLLRESTQGTVELLVARATLKREMRAQMTMIVARENNPLKFSPTVEVALQHLLSPSMPGFMPAGPALRDAFDDLRAHQIGVMAGMKSALDGVLQRFDPQQLEAKLTRKSAINSLIPATRKARLWESFQELFGQLSSEAQDDFEELFGRAFLRAYEEQLDRLAAEARPQPGAR